MSERKIAIIGDVHGCFEELSELVSILRKEGVEDIFHLGDLIDRGPDSGAVVDFVIRNNISGVLGNHESSILNSKYVDSSKIRNTEKKRSKEALDKVAVAWDYLFSLPKLHVIDGLLDYPVVLVHGGLWPVVPLYRQPKSVLFAQLIDKNRPGKTAWTTDEESIAKGFVPWWEAYDGEEYVFFGHTVFEKPFIKNRIVGLDTGCVFGGHLTAVILPDMKFVQVKAKKTYSIRKFNNYG